MVQPRETWQQRHKSWLELHSTQHGRMDRYLVADALMPQVDKISLWCKICQCC